MTAPVRGHEVQNLIARVAGLEKRDKERHQESKNLKEIVKNKQKEIDA
jgi:hypothetical protein